MIFLPLLISLTSFAGHLTLTNGTLEVRYPNAGATRACPTRRLCIHSSNLITPPSPPLPDGSSTVRGVIRRVAWMPLRSEFSLQLLAVVALSCSNNRLTETKKNALGTCVGRATSSSTFFIWLLLFLSSSSSSSTLSSCSPPSLVCLAMSKEALQAMYAP